MSSDRCTACLRRLCNIRRSLPVSASRTRKRSATADTLAEGRTAIAANGVVLRALELYVTQLHRRGEQRAAVAWAEVAADLACRNHPGRFCSPALEAVLADV